MAYPLIYIAVVAPLLVSKATFSIVAALFVAAHIALGIARPMIAANGDMAGLPASTAWIGAVKAGYDWSESRTLAQIAGCRHLRLDLPEIHYAVFLQTILTDNGLQWSSTRPTRISGKSDPPFIPANAPKPDCLVTQTATADGSISTRILRLLP
jgi:hypothetical protein